MIRSEDEYFRKELLDEVALLKINASQIISQIRNNYSDVDWGKLHFAEMYVEEGYQELKCILEDMRGKERIDKL